MFAFARQGRRTLAIIDGSSDSPPSVIARESVGRRGISTPSKSAVGNFLGGDAGVFAHSGSGNGVDLWLIVDIAKLGGGELI